MAPQWLHFQAIAPPIILLLNLLLPSVPYMSRTFSQNFDLIKKFPTSIETMSL